MRKFNILLLIIVSILSSCGNSKKNMTKDTQLIFTYEQTACFGQCPVFKLEIHENGYVKYEGIAFVSKEGKYTKQISQKQVEELVELFLAANFFEFEDEYTSPVQDFPTYYFGFTHDGKNKKIKDYHGTPEALKALRKPFIDLVKEEEGWKEVKK
jgi:hypothetical protein